MGIVEQFLSKVQTFTTKKASRHFRFHRIQILSLRFSRCIVTSRCSACDVGDAHERVGARAASSRPLCALPRACVHVGVGVRGENPVSRRACYAWQNTINTNAHDARRCCWERPARPAG